MTPIDHIAAAVAMLAEIEPAEIGEGDTVRRIHAVIDHLNHLDLLVDDTEGDTPQ